MIRTFEAARSLLSILNSAAQRVSLSPISALIRSGTPLLRRGPSPCYGRQQLVDLRDRNGTHRVAGGASLKRHESNAWILAGARPSLLLACVRLLAACRVRASSIWGRESTSRAISRNGSLNRRTRIEIGVSLPVVAGLRPSHSELTAGLPFFPLGVWRPLVNGCAVSETCKQQSHRHDRTTARPQIPDDNPISAG